MPIQPNCLLEGIRDEYSQFMGAYQDSRDPFYLRGELFAWNGSRYFHVLTPPPDMKHYWYQGIRYSYDGHSWRKSYNQAPQRPFMCEGLLYIWDGERFFPREINYAVPGPSNQSTTWMFLISMILHGLESRVRMISTLWYSHNPGTCSSSTYATNVAS